jgi:bifunctional enzyme Fae/Hps
MILDHKKRYLHIALNSTLSDAYRIIPTLPVSDRIILEAGTPLIKQFGIDAIRQILALWSRRVYGTNIRPYIVADMKTMDRAETEVMLAKSAGASGVIVLGQAALETVDNFIAVCRREGIDSFVDMMNVNEPIKIMRKLKNKPDVVLLHRGVDEEVFNKTKPIPYIQINKVLSSYNVLIGIGGGDTIREVQRAVLNNTSVVMVWKNFYSAQDNTSALAEEFLKGIK